MTAVIRLSLAQKTLDALGSKVAKEAPLNLEFTARAK